MNILVINWRCIKNPEAGGAEVHIDELLKRKPDNYNVDFVCSGYGGSLKNEFINGYNVIRIGNKFTFSVLFHIWFLLNRKKYYLIIDVVSKIGLCQHLYSGVPSISIVYHVHGWSIPFPLPAIEKIALHTYKNQKAITISESTKNELTQKFDFKNVSIVNIGIDVNSIKSFYGSKKKYSFIYVGRLVEYKRVDHIIKAFSKFKFDMPLCIVGKGPEESKLKKLVSDLGMSDSVVFAGFVSETEKYKLISESKCFVIASKKEGWGISITEAACLGLPAVGYDVAGVRDAVTYETGFLANEGNIDSLSDLMHTIISDDLFLNYLSKKSIEYSAQFDHSVVSSKFYKEIECLIGSQNSH